MWLINQNRTYTEETDGGFVYAPHVDRGGAALSTYANVGKLSPGDLTLSVAGGRILAIGVVMSIPNLSAPRPTSLADSGWTSPGFFAELEYHELETPVDIYTEIPRRFRQEEPAFDVKGQLKQGSYCEALSDEFADHFLTAFSDRIPDSIVAAKGGNPAGSAVDVGSATVSGLEDDGKKRTAYRRAAGEIEVRLRHAGYVQELSRQTDELLGDPGSGRRLQRSYTRRSWAVDLLLPDVGALVEMKSTLDADSIQQGVGQLRLYKSMLVALEDQLDFDPTALRLVLACPEIPDDQLRADLGRIGIACAWRRQNRWVDNADGHVTGVSVAE